MTPHPSPDTGTRAATQPRWSKEAIRQARQAPLLPLLRARGLALIEHEAGNFEPADHPGLLIKENYWRSADHDMSGTTGAGDGSGETAEGSPKGEPKQRELRR